MTNFPRKVPVTLGSLSNVLDLINRQPSHPTITAVPLSDPKPVISKERAPFSPTVTQAPSTANSVFASKKNELFRIHRIAKLATRITACNIPREAHVIVSLFHSFIQSDHSAISFTKQKELTHSKEDSKDKEKMSCAFDSKGNFKAACLLMPSSKEELEVFRGLGTVAINSANMSVPIISNHEIVQPLILDDYPQLPKFDTLATTCFIYSLILKAYFALGKRQDAFLLFKEMNRQEIPIDDTILERLFVEISKGDYRIGSIEYEGCTMPQDFSVDDLNMTNRPMPLSSKHAERLVHAMFNYVKEKGVWIRTNTVDHSNSKQSIDIDRLSSESASILSSMDRIFIREGKGQYRLQGPTCMMWKARLYSLCAAGMSSDLPIVGDLSGYHDTAIQSPPSSSTIEKYRQVQSKEFKEELKRKNSLVALWSDYIHMIYEHASSFPDARSRFDYLQDQLHPLLSKLLLESIIKNNLSFVYYVLDWLHHLPWEEHATVLPVHTCQALIKQRRCFELSRPQFSIFMLRSMNATIREYMAMLKHDDIIQGRLETMRSLRNSNDHSVSVESILKTLLNEYLLTNTPLTTLPLVRYCWNRITKAMGNASQMTSATIASRMVFARFHEHSGNDLKESFPSLKLKGAPFLDEQYSRKWLYWASRLGAPLTASIALHSLKLLKASYDVEGRCLPSAYLHAAKQCLGTTDPANTVLPYLLNLEYDTSTIMNGRTNMLAAKTIGGLEFQSVNGQGFDAWCDVDASRLVNMLREPDESIAQLARYVEQATQTEQNVVLPSRATVSDHVDSSNLLCA